MARRTATTRDRIDAIALELFLARGFDAVTSADLASACGISRPTLFRYVSQTALIVLDQVAAFGQLTTDRLRHCAGKPWAAITSALVSSYADLDSDSLMGKAFHVLRAEPDLRGRSGLLTREWRGALAQGLIEHGVEDPLLAEAMAGSALGIITAAFAGEWTPDQLTAAFVACAPSGDSYAGERRPVKPASQAPRFNRADLVRSPAVIDVVLDDLRSD